MELRHIRYFVAVAEELNFTRAAARLGIGQPPLSQQIKDLETELGVALLRRVPAGAELTEAGKAFLETGRNALAMAQNAATAATRAARGELGRLRLGFTGSAHFSANVTSAIREFRHRYPGVALQLEEWNTHKLVELLTAGALDAAFTHAGPEETGAHSTTLAQLDPLVAAISDSHRCAGEREVAVSSLAGDDFILQPRSVGPELRRIILKTCAEAGFEPKLGQEAPQLATVVSLVAAELGVSLVPSSMQQIQTAGVVYRPLAGKPAHVATVLAWRRSERSSVVRNLVSVVRERAPSGCAEAEARSGNAPSPANG